MIRFTRTYTEVRAARETDEYYRLHEALRSRSVPFFGVPLPWDANHLRWLLFAFRSKPLAWLSWMVYPALLLAGIGYWLITGVLVVAALLVAGFAVFLARGAGSAWCFLVNSLEEHGPVGRW